MDIHNKKHNNNLPYFISSIKLNLELGIKQKGFKRFTYFIARKKNLRNPILISNHPASCIEDYKLNRHYLTDPIIQFGLRSVAPFSWAECRIKSDSFSSSFIEKPKRYLLTDGYCFTLHDPNGCVSLLSVRDSLDPALLHVIEQHKAELQMLLIRAHQLMTLNPRLLDFIFSDSSTKPLTQREHEILKWSCIGKTYAEISLITGISVRTVKFHMRNIVEKLDVANAKHAIFKAQQEDLCLKLL